MLGILADSFMTATRTDTVLMRDARRARPQDKRPHRPWYYWRARPWRPVNPRDL